MIVSMMNEMRRLFLMLAGRLAKLSY